MEVIPWEHKEQFQRLVGDFRLSGTYHSAGREYTELFDALGSSQAPALRGPNPGDFSANGCAKGVASCADPTAQSVYFTGITDQQPFASVGGKISGTLQVGEYVKFQAGVGVTYDQSHLITAADACNPNFTSSAAAAGSCHSTAAAGSPAEVTGIPNPNFRPIIDLPGNRFSSDDGLTIDLWVTGVVMF
jgi:hypothetical protein